MNDKGAGLQIPHIADRTRNYQFTYKNNPDILASKDALRYRSGYLPKPGDTITLEGLTVSVVTVEHLWDYPKHNWEVEIEGDDVPALRELLTYKTEVNKREVPELPKEHIKFDTCE